MEKYTVIHKRIFKTAVLFLLLSFYCSTTGTSQTVFNYAPVSYVPAPSATAPCNTPFSFTPTFKITGIRITQNYYDNGTNSGSSFAFEVLFEYTNTFTGTYPPGNYYSYEYWLYTTNTSINQSGIGNNISNVPLGTTTGTGITSNSISYNGSLSLLGLSVNTTYTDQATINQFGFNRVDLRFDLPCYGRSAIVSANASPSLPITLGAFTAHTKNDKVQLSWTSYREEAFDAYEIEHSADARAWNTIATVKSRASKDIVEARLDYAYLHTTPVNGVNYYRLKMRDWDNSYSYSQVALTTVSKPESFYIYPNPAAASFKINGISAGEIALIDPVGRVVFSKAINGPNSDITLNGNILNGNYIVRFTDLKGQIHYSRLLVQR